MEANAKSKILIVDDDQGCRDLYRALLTPFGHEVLEARDGREGLEQARRHTPDLVVSDILMPTMNGYEFVSALRKTDAMRNVPIIFHSASFLDKETRSLGAACGVSHFILKPCEPDKALEAIHDALGLRPEARRVAPRELPQADAIPLLIDAFYEKGQQLDAVSVRLASLLELGLDLARAPAMSALLQAAGQGARNAIGASYSAVGILSGEGPQLAYYSLSGVGPEVTERISLSAFSGALFRSIVHDKEARSAFSAFSEPEGLDLPADHPRIRSFLGAPLRVGDRVHGWIYVADKLDSLAFSEQEAQILMALAAYVAVAYENAQRFHTIEERTRRLEEEVAERKRAEERFRMLVETAPTGIIIADSKGRIVDVNLHSLNMFGYERSELVGQLMEVLLPEKLQSVHQQHRAAYAEHPHARPMGLGMDLFGRRKDGTEFPVEISLGPLATRGEMLISAAVVDITTRKKMEERLRVSQRMEAIGKLAGGVAHDFNNLLTVIMGCCDAISMELSGDHPAMARMETVKKAASSAADLTRQLLAFGRKQILQPQVVEPGKIVGGIAKMLARLIGEDISLTIKIEPEAGQVSADQGQLEQVLVNLAANARDAMPGGGKLLIEVANADLDEAYKKLHPPAIPGSYVVISVTDTGCGMDSKTQSQIFDPFFTTKELGKGTGLGLATVYGIVKQSGGYIWVYSEIAKGTVFKVYLPRVKQTTCAAERLDPDGPPQRGSETILLAEDSASLREIAQEYLQSLGYTVIEAGSGKEAFQRSEAFGGEIHMLLTDVVMPEMGGRQLAEAIAAKRPIIKVLYTSGYTDDAIVRQGVLEPGIAFIQKPYRPRALARKVREILDRPEKEAS